MTERRCMIEETPEDAAHIMSGIIGNWLVRNGESFIALWNLALDERGLPNQVGATGRRGVVTIQHETGEVIRNLEYFMLRAFGQDVEPGSVVVRSSTTRLTVGPAAWARWLSWRLMGTLRRISTIRLANPSRRP